MKNTHLVFMWAFLCVLSCLAFAEEDKVIYGIDNRLDVYQTENQLYRELVKSTAAMIPAFYLKNIENDYLLSGTNLVESYNVCPYAAFATQLKAARCSGFLVAPDLLVTAGHCIKNQMNCEENYWVFDFELKNPAEIPNHFNSSEVYRCVEIINQEYGNSENDFALIRLDRVVADRKPLRVRTEGKVSDNAKLVLIGNPSGIPTKITDGAIVRTNSHPLYFVTNTDSFSGNSGAAVFDAMTGLVEGILVRGENDFIDQPSGCSLPQVCTEGACRGEDVTRITNIPELSKTLPILFSTKINVKEVNADRVQLDWDSDTDAHHYLVAYAPEGSVPICGQGKVSQDNFISLTQLRPSTLYSVRVCVVTASGEIYKKSAISQFRTQAPLVEIMQGPLMEKADDIALILTPRNIFGTIAVRLEHCRVSKKGKDKSCENENYTLSAMAPMTVVLKNLRNEASYNVTLAFAELSNLPLVLFSFQVPKSSL